VKQTVRRAAAQIAENEFWLLWVYGAPLLFSSNLPLSIFLAALTTIPFFWMARRVARGAWSVSTPLDLPLALLVALGMVGVAVTTDLAVSLRMYGALVGCVALYYGIVNGFRLERLTGGMWLLLILGAAMGMVGLLGLRDTNKFLPLLLISRRLFQFMPNASAFAFLNPNGFTPNIVAGAVTPVIPIALALAWVEPARINSGARSSGNWLKPITKAPLGVSKIMLHTQRVVPLGIAVLLTGIVLLTQSRGALLGLLAALAVMAGWRFPRLIWLAPIAAVMLIGAVLWLGPTNLVGAIQSIAASGIATNRLEVWDRALWMMRDFPITGIGMGRFETTLFTWYPPFINSPSDPLPHAHNLYLEMGVDYGIAGLVAFIGVCTATLGAGIAAVRRTARRQIRSGNQAGLAIGLLGGYVVYLVHGLLDGVAVSTKVSVVVWMIVGFRMVLYLSCKLCNRPS